MVVSSVAFLEPGAPRGSGPWTVPVAVIVALVLFGKSQLGRETTKTWLLGIAKGWLLDQEKSLYAGLIS